MCLCKRFMYECLCISFFWPSLCWDCTTFFLQRSVDDDPQNRDIWKSFCDLIRKPGLLSDALQSICFLNYSQATSYIENIEVKRLYFFQKKTSGNNIFWRSCFKHLQQRWGESLQCCCFFFLLHDLKYVVCDDFIVHQTDGDEQDIFRSYLIPQTCKIIFAALHKL